MAQSAVAPKAPQIPRPVSGTIVKPQVPQAAAALTTVVDKPKSVPPPVPRPKLVTPISATVASAPPVIDVPPPPPVMQRVMDAYEGKPSLQSSEEIAPPSSGVRISEKLEAIETPVPPPPAVSVFEEAPPSFQVYSLAELDRRNGGPVSLARNSITALHGGRGSKWGRSKHALSAVVYALRSWVALGKGRPPLRDAIRAPGQVLAVEVKASLRATDWKKVATVGGIGFGIFAALLTVVLLVADLTDDMKPTHTGAAAQAALVPETPVPVTTMMTPPDSPPAPTVEYVYETPPAAAKPKAAFKPARPKVVIPPTPGQKIPKGKKPGDLLIPY